MTKIINIKNKKIGKNSPCFIIAEAGVNHNGKLELAKKLVDVAVESGADAVKFQTYKSEEVVTDKAGIADYAKKNIGMDIKQIEMIKKFELKYGDFKKLKIYCDKKEIMFLSTPHSFDAIDFLDELVPAFKFGSGDLTNIPALQHAAEKGKPIILGAGMATLNEIEEALNAIKETGNNQVVALHCTTNYPCPFEEVNMNAMRTMQESLACLVGYSDHTMGITVPVMAVTLGAVVIEKHFTLDQNIPGPDHKASLEPSELKNMVTEIRNVEKAFGRYEKKPTESEIKIIEVVRKSLVAKKNIEKGTKIQRDMLYIKRPGNGIQPFEINNVVGKIVKKQIKKDSTLFWNDIK
jgi:N,N'-diacetyllegionaminate synthase